MWQLALSFLASFLIGVVKTWMDARTNYSAGGQAVANAANAAADDLEKDYDEIASRGGYRRDKLLERLRSGTFGTGPGG